MIETHIPSTGIAGRHEGARIAVFTGSRRGDNPLFAQVARELGSLLAEHHIELVFGGTSGGLMEVVADAVSSAGGNVIGVVPADYWPGLHYQHCAVLHEVADLRERKARMASLADAFIVLPGGPGTIDELIETLTLAHIGKHHKPIALCNTGEFFTPFLSLLDHLLEQGMAEGDLRQLLILEPTPALLLCRLFADPRWLFAPFPKERSAHG